LLLVLELHFLKTQDDGPVLCKEAKKSVAKSLHCVMLVQKYCMVIVHAAEWTLCYRSQTVILCCLCHSCPCTACTLHHALYI